MLPRRRRLLKSLLKPRSSFRIAFEIRKPGLLPAFLIQEKSSPLPKGAFFLTLSDVEEDRIRRTLREGFLLAVIHDRDTAVVREQT